MRTVAPFAAVLALAVALPALAVRGVRAGETIIMEQDSGVALDAGDRCGCGNRQSPPWHGNVAGDPCGPSCPPPNVFHANPCGQLWLKHQARQQGMVPPTLFPRMCTRMTEGYWPTPRPISLPRCPRCGAHIEGGF